MAVRRLLCRGKDLVREDVHACVAAGVLDQLLEDAVDLPRNYILDQTKSAVPRMLLAHACP